MKLTKNKTFFGILIFGLITNLFVLFDIQYLCLRAIFSFIFLTMIPGLLIMLMLKIRKIGFWEYLVYTIGLSIAFLMFAGLFVNWTLPLFGIDKPLSLIPLLISFNTFLLIFWLIAYKRNKKISFKIKLLKLDRLNKAFFTIPAIFLILSISGAIILNNQGPNHLTMIMLGGIAIYVFLAVLFPSLFEGFGVSVLEAMACRKPVIATKTGEIPYIITNLKNGLLINPNNSESLYEKIKFLIGNEDVGIRLEENGRKLVKEKYGWKKTAREIKERYHILFKSKKCEF